MDILDAAAFLNESARATCDVYDVESSWMRRTREQDDQHDAVVTAVRFALGYRLIASDDEDGRASFGAFGPMIESGDATFPPRLDEVDEEVRRIWSTLLPHLTAPVVKARLNDLLWTSRYGERPHSHALQAVEGYLAAARIVSSVGVEVVDVLDRAIELTRLLNAPDSRAEVVSHIHSLATEELLSVDAASRPGISIPLLRLLVGLPNTERPGDIQSLLLRAHEMLMGSHPLIREPVFQLLEVLLRGNRDELRMWQRAKVQMFLDWALQQTGFLRGVELAKALELASNTPDSTDIANEIRRHIQGIDPDDDDLKTISAEVQIPTEEIERYIESVVGHDELLTALGRAGVFGPPTSSLDQTLSTVERQMREFPFQFLMSQVVTHAAGYPIQILDTEDAKKAFAVARQDVMSISIHAIFLQDALDRIRARYGPAQSDALVDFFHSDLIADHEADAFARALEHFWDGHFDETIHVAIPRIEGVLRKLLMHVGGVVYREPRGATAGGVRSLGEVLQSLRPVMDSAWWRFFWVLLCEPLGLNLRNEYMHGLAGRGSRRDAALVLKAAIHLSLLRLTPRPAAGQSH